MNTVDVHYKINTKILLSDRLKKSRDGTNTAKQSMDSFNLSLQNLLYEVMHLKKEVTKCVNFKVILLFYSLNFYSKLSSLLMTIWS